MPGQAQGGAAFATADAITSDDSNGVLVKENGEKLTGEYVSGDLNALVYLASKDVIYVQYLTAEDIEPKSEDSKVPSGGCGVLAGGEVGFGVYGLMALTSLLPVMFGKRRGE